MDCFLGPEIKIPEEVDGKSFDSDSSFVDPLPKVVGANEGLAQDPQSPTNCLCHPTTVMTITGKDMSSKKLVPPGSWPENSQLSKLHDM